VAEFDIGSNMSELQLRLAGNETVRAKITSDALHGMLLLLNAFRNTFLLTIRWKSEAILPPKIITSLCNARRVITGVW